MLKPIVAPPWRPPAPSHHQKTRKLQLKKIKNECISYLNSIPLAAIYTFYKCFKKHYLVTEKSSKNEALEIEIRFVSNILSTTWFLNQNRQIEKSTKSKKLSCYCPFKLSSKYIYVIYILYISFLFMINFTRLRSTYSTGYLVSVVLRVRTCIWLPFYIV